MQQSAYLNQHETGSLSLSLSLSLSRPWSGGGSVSWAGPHASRVGRVDVVGTSSKVGMQAGSRR